MDSEENKRHILNPPLWPSVQVKKLPITSETFSFTFHLFTQWHKVGFPSLSESASLLFCSEVADYIPITQKDVCGEASLMVDDTRDQGE